MIPASHALIDAHASLSQLEIRAMTSRILDKIVGKGSLRRSLGQKRRYANAKTGGHPVLPAP